MDKVSCRETGNQNGLDEANRQLKKLYADRDNIQSKAQQTDIQESDITESLSLTQQVIDDWFGLSFDVQRQYTRLIVHHADIQEVSPHFLKLEILLKPPLDTTMTGFIYRHRGAKEVWSEYELDMIKRMYPHADKLDILKALPLRTWDSIIRVASIKGVVRKTRGNTSEIPDNLTFSDMQFMRQHQDDMHLLAPEYLKNGTSFWVHHGESYQEMEREMIRCNLNGSSC